MNSGSATSARPTAEASSRPELVRQDSKVDSRFCCNICLEAVAEPVVTQCGHLYCWPCLYRWLEPGMEPDERISLGLLRRPVAIDSSRRACPVCKAACSVPTLVPIYVRSYESTSVAKSDKDVASREEEVDSADQRFRNQGETAFSPDDPADGDIPIVTGLRRRNHDTSGEPVPSRPAAISPRPSPSTPQTPQQYRNNNTQITPMSPSGHRSSLSHGLLLSFQQATSASSSVPPLHRRDGADHRSDLDTHPGATEYLSRLLLMLASFVVLCLLTL
jgi:hypothetical protein